MSPEKVAFQKEIASNPSICLRDILIIPGVNQTYKNYHLLLPCRKGRKYLSLHHHHGQLHDTFQQGQYTPRRQLLAKSYTTNTEVVEGR